MTDRQAHWQGVYTEKEVNQVGWYADHLKTSLEWIDELGAEITQPFIDVGGGASTLVDDLLEKDYQDITVLDLSAKALEVVRTRLGSRAHGVAWIDGDITRVNLPTDHFRLWHDRAAFHFLIEPEQRLEYRERLLQSLRAGGYLLMGVFELQAPPQCSGLPVQRYSAESLAAEFGDSFQLCKTQKEIHVTPSGFEQAYVYCLFERVG